jgi:homoserine dehydrogenase
MPIVRAIGDGLAGDRITRIAAILNGTTNVVLSRMDAGCSLAVALEEAQANGYAEADPAADLDGADACAKLAILCALAFGVRVDPDAIASRPVSSLSACDFERAKRRGCTLRQLACAEFDAAADALTAWVAPVPVPSSSFFGRAVGPQNAALITCEHSGEIGIFGAGAGGRPTSAAVLSDLVAIGRDRAAIVPPPHLSSSYTFHPSDFAYREAL